jgi:hypothetical protein
LFKMTLLLSKIIISSSLGDKFEVLNPEHSHDSGGCGDLAPRTPSSDGSRSSGFVTESIAMTENPVIIQAAGGIRSELQSQRASQLLGQKVSIEAIESGITRVVFNAVQKD